jgi:hypothetical protein
VIIEEDMLGLILILKYAYYDITDEKKFSELEPRKYLKRYISTEKKMVVIEADIWATGLQKDGILNLFDIQHFKRSVEINAYVNILLTCIHEGYLWLNGPISIDTDLIVHITGLPSQGEDPSQIFRKKTMRRLYQRA